MTNRVFNRYLEKGLQLGQRKLEMELETTKLSDLHDRYAVRLVGIPVDVDPDLVKFYLS